MGSRFLSAVRVSIFVIEHILTSVLLLYGSGIFNLCSVLMSVVFEHCSWQKKLLDANCVDFVCHRHSQLGLHCRRRLRRMRQSWEYLYSGHKGTMKRLLTAALCQLAAAAGSSKCKLRTGTINKGMKNRVCICTFVHLCTCCHLHYASIGKIRKDMSEKNSTKNKSGVKWPG